MQKPGRRSARALFVLQGPAGHASWMSDLKDAAYNLTGQPEILDQDFRATLEPAYFKAHKDFKTAFAAAAKDDDEKCDPFDKKDQEFATLCFKHALSTGNGFHDWVKGVYHTARDALSREIKDQTQSVRRGDIFGLLRAIQLSESVNQLELFDPTQLDAALARFFFIGLGLVRKAADDAERHAKDNTDRSGLSY